MKRLALLPVLLLLTFFGCQNEESVSPSKGSVTFSVSGNLNGGGRTAGSLIPAFALVSIEGENGFAQNNLKIPIFSFGQGYITENLEMPTGNYKLTHFLVLNEANKVIYASPLEGSEMAQLVDTPLAINFIVGTSGTKVSPQVLVVSDNQLAEEFGYVNFEFEVVGINPQVFINARVVIKVGEVIYENLDAHVKIKGYSENGVVQWEKDYDYKGPTDKLEVKNGLHHYSIELVNKWGVHDVITDISAVDLWNGRADSSLPVTYNLSGTKEAKQIYWTVTSAEVNTENGIQYQPETRDIYAYNEDGTLRIINHEVYNLEKNQFQGLYVDSFVYTDGKVSKITRSLNGTKYEEYLYAYGNQNVITVINFATGLTTTQTMDGNNSLLTLSTSNGQSFEEKLVYDFKNITGFEVHKADELCNNGEYGYDKNINPFRHLGFRDFYFQNWSVNNRVKEDVHYLACSFPTLIPVAHHYQYDSDGYPVEKITSYANTSAHRKVEFGYR